MKSSADPVAAVASRRANQKRRTRQALIDAAIALRKENRNPTFGDIADRALVSRATAYRYFPSLEALLSETVTDRGMKPLEDVWREGDDPLEAIGRATAALHQLLLRDESGLHVMERSFMTVWLESRERETVLRPGRRLTYIEPIVASLEEDLGPAARRRLKQALTLVMGTEAVIAARDVAGASVQETLEVTAWAARALVRQALAEAAQRGRRRKAGSGARRGDG